MVGDETTNENERTLRQLILQEGVLNVQQSVAVVLQLLKAVGELHGKGKTHRAISADSIVVDQAMSVRLGPVEPVVTFGGIGSEQAICPMQLQNISPISLPGEIETAKEILINTGILLEPRQIDFYQLGVLLCFMVSGHSVSDYLRSCKAKADVPEIIGPLIDRALGLNSKDCFESSDDFATALEAALSGEPAADLETPRGDGTAAKDDLPFETLGHYRIIERIGHGGMGDVYKGYEEDLDRFVAIKVLPQQFERQKDFVRRFIAEATAVAKLDHPNVVRIYYTGKDHGRHFFAIQYVEGQTLADLLARRGKLSAAEAVPIMQQCLAGLGAAHKLGLIHRDVKPSNILLDRQSGRALVTDFGLVKAVHAETQVTVTGMIMGTADYIAPEQARGSAIDARADLYAVGVLMYQMLSGRLPFEAQSATSMMFQHAYEAPPPLRQIAADVPESLAQIVMKLMAKAPDDRYDSAEEVLAALSNIDTSVDDVSETGIVEPSDFYASTALPVNLTRLAPTGWFGRLRAKMVDFFGTHAPQVIQQMQTTQHQVDGAVAEYEHRREQLAKLTKEARTITADLQQQAQQYTAAADAAAKRAQTATDTTAKHQALQEQHENEQAAAEVSQLLAEQQEQLEDLELRLAKLNATLVQLRSQRHVLNARLNAANAHLKSPSELRWYRKKKLLYAAGALGLICLVAFVAYALWPTTYETSWSVVGRWESVDFVKEVEDFKPSKKQRRGDLHLKGLTFYEDGKTSGPWTWQDDWLWHPGDKTKARYVIKQMDGSYYLFMEWISGDVTMRGHKPSYYVMKKVNIIVPGVGVGPFRLGMSKDDVLKRLGEPRVIFYGEKRYTLGNLPKTYYMRYGDIAFHILNGSVDEITVLGPSYKFANGLGVGDSEQKVKEAFGYDFGLQEFDFKNFLTYEDEGLVFEIRNDNKTVMEINIRSKHENTEKAALHIAAKKGHLKTVHRLISKGANVKGRTQDGMTPLHLAVQNGHIATAEVLISHGADINVRCKSGNTPLHLAAQNGHMATAEVLISLGADIKAKCKSGNTPLHLAASEGHPQTVGLLIAKGADVNAKNKSGKIPLDLAIEHGHTAVAELLRAKTSAFSKQITLKVLPEDPRFADKVKRPDKAEIARLRACARESELLEELGNAAVAWLEDGKQSSILEVNKRIDSLFAEPNLSVGAYFAAAKIANLCGQSDKAISILEDVASKHGDADAPGSMIEPVDLMAYYWIGSIARHSGDGKRASRAYETIIEKSKKWEGLNQERYAINLIHCNTYLAEIASYNFKDNTLALKRLDEVEKAIESVEKDLKPYEVKFFQDWAKYKASVIKNGKSQARQQLAAKDSKKVLSIAFMIAVVQLSLTHLGGETDSSLYDGKPENGKILGEALLRLVTESTKSPIDRRLAKFLAGTLGLEGKEFTEAEKHFSELFEEDSYFSPIAGLALAHCKKEQGENAEADDVLKQVKNKYPGYKLAVDSQKKP